jgi:tetratricopeptide (TPR) repeat protein
MARYALVVGIAQYDNFRNLDKAATDAAAIARLLQVHGQYQVEPLPKRLVAAENRWELATDKKLTGKDLGQTLETFLLEQANGHEALLYFAGHGFEVPGLGRKKKGYLATSDCTSDGRNAILFSDLNDLIRESRLSSLVVILDCCHAGSFLERTLLESTLTAFKEKKDYYLITACRSFERSREGEEHGVFTASVLKGLQAENADSEGAVTGDRLFDFIQRELRQSGQEPIRMGIGRSVTLVRYQFQTGTATPTESTLFTGHNARQLVFPRIQTTLKKSNLVRWAFAALIFASTLGTLVVFFPQITEKLGIVKPSCFELASKEKKIIIAIAKFQDSDHYANRAPFIEERLLDRIEERKQPDVVTCQLNETVSTQSQAKDSGEKIGATVIVWGRHNQLALEIYVTTIETPVKYLTSLQIPATDAQSFETQIKDLPQIVNVMVAFALREIYRSKNHYQESREVLDTALFVAEQSKLNLSSRRVMDLLSLAYFFSGQSYLPSDWDCSKARQDCLTSLNAYRKSESLNKEFYLAIIEQGILQERLANPNEALKIYTKLIEITPKSEIGLQAVRYRGSIYLEKNAGKAVEDFQFLCQQKPDLVCFKYLGQAQLLAGQVEQSKSTYQEVRKYLNEDKNTKHEILDELNALAKQRPDLSRTIKSLIIILKQ